MGLDFMGVDLMGVDFMGIKRRFFNLLISHPGPISYCSLLAYAYTCTLRRGANM